MDIDELWDFDMTAAPKSYTEISEKVVGGKTHTVLNEVSIYIIAAFDNEKTGRTRWLVSEGRWEGFKKGEEPYAFMRWPIAPKRKEVSQ